jgi:WD40-like Beta Propeller Repeat
MNADGLSQTNITNNPAYDELPDWWPDGSALYFDSNRSGSFDVYHVKPDGTGLSFSGLSGDGNDFGAVDEPGLVGLGAVTTDFGGDNEILAYYNGVGKLITNNSADDSYPDWQPVVNNYPRPKGATPVRLAIVPAFQPCVPNTAPYPNATHRAPLNAQACVPPTPVSSYLTVGAPDYNGVGANSIGSVLFRVRATSPEDILIAVSDTDVRCKGATGSCPNGILGDYAGNLRFDSTFRITDRGNGGIGSGTVVDLPVAFNVPCTPTSSTTVGSTCSINTSINTLFGATTITDSGRSIWQLIGDVKVYDGGADGVASTTGDNTLFAGAGLFAP